MISYKKRQLKLVNAFAKKSGIRITEMGERAQRPKDRLYNCFIKGFLIFLVSYALNMLFVTSFDLPCSRLVVAAFAIILSVFSALFYYNRLCFNLGFVGVFLFESFGKSVAITTTFKESLSKLSS